MENRTFTDQLGSTIHVNFPTKRIISLVPSQTELLFDLGLDQEIIGITKFCIHPKDKFKNTTKVGGTKNVDLQKIISLKPDLIIGNKEENLKEDIETLNKLFPVWMSDIFDLQGALKMIFQIGELVGKKEIAREMVEKISAGFELINITGQAQLPKKVIYFIWKSPYMVAGKRTFINDMLQHAGFENITNPERYPIFESEDLKLFAPDFVFLSSEPYPFKDIHISEFKSLWPGASVRIVDGEMFSWYGSRLLKSAAYFKSLIC